MFSVSFLPVPAPHFASWSALARLEVCLHKASLSSYFSLRFLRLEMYSSPSSANELSFQRLEERAGEAGVGLCFAFSPYTICPCSTLLLFFFREGGKCQLGSSKLCEKENFGLT